MEINRCYLGLGTNLGNKVTNLITAQNLIRERIGVISKKSKIYETPPFGFESSHSFLNMAIEVETFLSPNELLKSLQEIELEMGRTTKSTNGIYSSRIIDIDILLYNQLEFTSENLVIPHSEMANRKFVLIPLIDISTELKLPNGQLLTKVLEDCLDTSVLSVYQK